MSLGQKSRRCSAICFANPPLIGNRTKAIGSTRDEATIVPSPPAFSPPEPIGNRGGRALRCVAWPTGSRGAPYAGRRTTNLGGSAGRSGATRSSTYAGYTYRIRALST